MNPTITIQKRSNFRKWLQKNHKKEKRVSVILYKKHTHKPSPSHRVLIEEAICFGWIDTTIKRIDEDRFQRNFSKRNKNSKWSDNTLGYAKALLKKGKMAPEGLKYYKLGKKMPTHDVHIPKNPDMPIELNTALSKNKKNKEFFNSFPPSKKKILYRWILSGKLPETRVKRVNEIMKLVRARKKNLY
jgi:uncharacterized protein YdeI (YjbR/CyaY-like superfamily)